MVDLRPTCLAELEVTSAMLRCVSAKSRADGCHQTGDGIIPIGWEAPLPPTDCQ